MKILAALGLFAAALQERADVQVSAVQPREGTWLIRGLVSLPEGASVRVTAVRIERRWDPAGRRFQEMLAPENTRRGTAEVARRSFEARLPAGPTGLFRLSLVHRDRTLLEERFLLGDPAALFARTGGHLNRFAAVQESLRRRLREIEEILEHEVDLPTRRQKEDFIRRVAEDEAYLEEASTFLDLSATIAALRDICFYVRSAQIWNRLKDEVPLKDPDQVGIRKRPFLRHDLTLENVRQAVESSKEILAAELRVSSAAFLEAMCPAGGERNDKALQALRRAGAEALKLLLKSPARDEDFEALAARASGAGAEEIEPLRTAFRDALKALAPR